MTAPVPVALLYQAGDLGGQLKTALHELGAAIVYESQASDLDRVALEGSGARIVVFNLDPESEAQIDHVYDVLDDGDYEVVFNDADASAQLSGWDQARWARNLAAKILHKPEIAVPPRPAWAESVPVPGSRPAAAKPAPSAPPPVAAPEPPPEAPAATSVTNLSEWIDATPVEAEHPKAEPPEAVSEMHSPVAAADAPTLRLPVPDEFNLEEMLDIGVSEPTQAGTSAEAPAEPTFASALEDFAAHIPAHQYQQAPVDEFASELDALFAETRSPRPAAPAQTQDLHYEPAQEESGQVDFPVIFDQLDEAAASIPEAIDGSFRPAALPARAAEPEPVAKTAEPFEPLLPPEWSLEPIEDDPAPGAVKPVVTSSAFGIETMSTSDFMTGPADEAAAAAAVPVATLIEGMSLELMPMEDAVAPQAYADASADNAAALESSIPGAKLQVGTGAKLGHVVVLGASIGGPEAVREFLGALPAQFPALFVLVQHMGDEFLELMSAQLAKAVRLTVRTPTHGERIGHGEIVIVPTRNRLQIDDEGVVTLSPLLERTAYSPSIDQVMRDVADAFGSKAVAIVFSGMAQDAIDGSKYVKSRGGAVWIQDPQTCTISTMVESVRQTGTVGFIGSPQELAEKMIADFGKN